MAKAEFYDVKLRKKVSTDVVDKVKYQNGRYAVKGKTSDGRNLIRFVSESDFKKY